MSLTVDEIKAKIAVVVNDIKYLQDTGTGTDAAITALNDYKSYLEYELDLLRKKS
jgi:hypothetical protein